LARGYSAFVLDYETAPKYPAALLQFSSAVSLVRKNADELHVDQAQIAVCGFSAGTHLAGMLGASWREPFIKETLGIEDGENRPNALVLCYLVVTSGQYAHRSSFEALLGADAPRELIESVSLEHMINNEMSPAFIWHTCEDDTVPVENAILFARALRQQHPPFELHIYPKRVHGLSLCSNETDNKGRSDPHVGGWIGLCDEWLQLNFTHFYPLNVKE
jgi:Esterase/lipase